MECPSKKCNRTSSRSSGSSSVLSTCSIRALLLPSQVGTHTRLVGDGHESRLAVVGIAGTLCVQRKDTRGCLTTLSSFSPLPVRMHVLHGRAQPRSKESRCLVVIIYTTKTLDLRRGTLPGVLGKVRHALVRPGRTEQTLTQIQQIGTHHVMQRLPTRRCRRLWRARSTGGSHAMTCPPIIQDTKTKCMRKKSVSSRYYDPAQNETAGELPRPGFAERDGYDAASSCLRICIALSTESSSTDQASPLSSCRVARLRRLKTCLACSSGPTITASLCPRVEP